MLLRTTHSVPMAGPKSFYRMAVATVRPKDASALAMPPLLCLHGLTRNRHDFDRLADTLGRDRLVVTADMAGRGDSDWPGADLYRFPQYLNDVSTLIALILSWANADRLDLLGTSMGGLIGMLLAAKNDAPLRCLVLNDIGPFVPQAALIDIAKNVGRPARFSDRAEAEEAYRRRFAGWGPMTDAEFAYLFGHSVRTDGAAVTVNYDPTIGDALRSAEIADLDLWAAWESMPTHLPCLVLRGSDSPLLSRETTDNMVLRHSLTDVIEIAGTGHAPHLQSAQQISLVGGFLATSQAPSRLAASHAK